MADFTQATEYLLIVVVGFDDFELAISNLQSAIGIDKGSVAAIIFWPTFVGEWPTASAKRRRSLIQQYIKFERDMAEGKHDDEYHEYDPGVVWDEEWLC